MTLMMIMRFSLLVCITGVLVGTEAFVPLVTQKHLRDAAAAAAAAGLRVASSSSSSLLMAASKPPPSNQQQHYNAAAAGGFARFFGLVAAASVLSFNIVDPASAANNMLEINYKIPSPFASTSIQLADTIKTLDFSLPSYDDIKDPKVSIENTNSLYVDPSLVNKYGVIISQSKNTSPDTMTPTTPVKVKKAMGAAPGDAKKSATPSPKPAKVTYEF